MRAYLLFLLSFAIAVSPLEAAATKSIVKSVQQASITLKGVETLSAVVTIKQVDPAMTIIVRQGMTSAKPTSFNMAQEAVRIALTSGNTVTATRDVGGPNAVTVYFTVIEFRTGVNSIQQGTIPVAQGRLAASTTIRQVGKNAFVLLLGDSAPAKTLDVTEIMAAVELTNSTTVTAHVCGTARSSYVVGFMVVDLDSTVVAAVQPVAHSDVGSEENFFVDKISPVDISRSLVFYEGSILETKHGFQSNQFTLELVDPTTVVLSRIGHDLGNKTIFYTVVSLQSAILNGPVQRGDISLSSRASSSVVLRSPVRPETSFANWTNSRCHSGNADSEFSAISLTDGRSVTAFASTNSPAIDTYEVVSF